MLYNLLSFLSNFEQFQGILFRFCNWIKFLNSQIFKNFALFWTESSLISHLILLTLPAKFALCVLLLFSNLRQF